MLILRSGEQMQPCASAAALPGGGGSAFIASTLTNTFSDDVKWLGTARARVGYTPYNNFLLYGTGGLAWERLDQIESQSLTAPGVTQTIVTINPTDWFGWVAGVGLEARLFNNNWIARVEYLHYDFGSTRPSTTVVTSAPGSFSDSVGRQTIDVVRGGISYKFCSDYCTSDFGKGPVVTRY
jgi:outer membrane immunogenic protein